MQPLDQHDHDAPETFCMGHNMPHTQSLLHAALQAELLQRRVYFVAGHKRQSQSACAGSHSCRGLRHSLGKLPNSQHLRASHGPLGPQGNSCTPTLGRSCIRYTSVHSLLTMSLIMQRLHLVLPSCELVSDQQKLLYTSL